MMRANKGSWIAHARTVSFTLFFVFAGFFFIESRFTGQVLELDRQGRERGLPTSIAPQNLEGTPEMFRLSLRVESRDFPTEEMTRTEAWRKLQDTVTVYARRLELLESQNRRRSLWITWLYPLSAVGMAVFAWLGREKDYYGTDRREKVGKTATDPT